MAEIRTHDDELADVLFHKEHQTALSYEQILEDVQKYMIENHASAVSTGDKEQIQNLIRQYITLKQYTAKDRSTSALTKQLYESMAGFAFLQKYLCAPDTEEININAWDDIEIIRAGGRPEKLEEKFSSPTQAVDIIRRMLAPTGTTIDNTTPYVLSNIDANTRICAMKTPLVDEDVGISASIRIVNRRVITREMLLLSGAASGEMLDFLEVCMKHGVSVCIGGATGSGKTTLMAWLLSNVPDNRRLVTIEEGSREFHLVKRDKDGKVINSVCHLLTRHHDNSDVMDISQDDLLEGTLRMHPDVIGIGEIRAAAECMAVAEASRTGHTCITTIHSNSAEESYMRMMSLAKRKNDLQDDIMMQIMVEAFPIIAYTKQLEDGSRKIMEIREAEDYREKQLVSHPLFHFDITGIEKHSGKTVIDGKHIRCGGISETLEKRLIENGLPMADVTRFSEGRIASQWK